MTNRRDFLKFSLGGLGTLALPMNGLAQPSLARAEDPHFFLHVYIYGGIDSLFMFDSRPRAMTAAGCMHAYVKDEPSIWTGANGVSCLATPLMKKLEPHRSRFSVINGAFMATSFDGHAQNVNFLFTGNPFGGESYVPHLNARTSRGFSPRPLDAVQGGSFPLDATNGGQTVPLSGEAAFRLIDKLKVSTPMDPSSRLSAFISSRFGNAGLGRGRFSSGARAMSSSYSAAPSLSAQLQRAKLSDPSKNLGEEARFLEMMGEFFREGICSSAILMLIPPKPLDVHAGVIAKDQVPIYEFIADRLKTVFDVLEKTPFDEKRSLFDVTTVLFSSEFGRTLRQANLPLEDTGTDHNSLNNSMLIGGKGIRPDLVIGETDWRVAQEVLSGAHLALDPAKLKLMGKPFDFASSVSRPDKPANYVADDYLTMASVINTIYSLFSVKSEKWRTVQRDGPKAPVISRLIL